MQLHQHLVEGEKCCGVEWTEIDHLHGRKSIHVENKMTKVIKQIKHVYYWEANDE